MSDVLLITIDSLRADHVGYHGYERKTTPTIDEFASDASRFMNTYAHIGGTRFAFPSILTGVTPMMYGGYERVSDGQTLISEVFQEAGYRTGGIHSNLYISADYGYDRGFDLFFDSKSEASVTSRTRQSLKTRLEGSRIYPVLQWAYDMVESTSGVNIGSYHVPGDEITDRAINFLQNHDSSQSTFLWVHYMDVHHPFFPPEEYQRLFLDEPMSKQASIRLRRKFSDRPSEVTDDELEQFIGLYDAEIRFTDSEINRLLSVARKDLTDPTIAITADHGEHFLERGYFSGALVYDVKLHVPLAIDGLDGSASYDELVGLTDIPTTLVDNAGLQIPDNFHGYSLVDLVKGGHWPRESIVGGHGLDHSEYMIRTPDWKYIDQSSNGEELYNLVTDPEETENVIKDHPDRADQLSQELDNHRLAVKHTETSVEAVEMEEEVRERLRRLGYDE